MAYQYYKSEIHFFRLVSFIAAALIVFSGCGKKADSENSNQATRGPDSPSGGNPSEPLFRAGDPVTFENFPAFDVHLLSQLTDYLNAGGFKAIALSINGLGYLAFDGIERNNKVQSQAEQNRMALEACQVASGDSPCAIFAEGNTVKYDEGEYFQNMRTVLAFGARPFDPTQVPFVPDAAREILADYENWETHKALSFSLRGFGCVHRKEENLDEALRRNRECCEYVSLGELCVAYSANDNVLFNRNGLDFPRESSLKEYFDADALDPNNIPFMNANTASNFVNQYMNAMDQSPDREFALAIHGLGAAAYAGRNNMNEARQAALDECNANLKSGTFECVIYAENDTVVFSEASLKGLERNP